MTARLPIIPAILLSLLLSSPLWAAGDSEPTPQQDPNLRQAIAAIQAERYADAVPLLRRVLQADGRNADAYNWLGYALRKQGRLDEAVQAYGEALRIDPRHRGAHEYLGEAYLMLNELAKAEEHLARLDALCLFGCEEYTELKEAVAAYKAGRAKPSR